MRSPRPAAAAAARPRASSARTSPPARGPPSPRRARSQQVFAREPDEPLLVGAHLVQVDVGEAGRLAGAALPAPRLGVGPERHRLLEVLRLDDLGARNEVRR